MRSPHPSTFPTLLRTRIAPLLLWLATLGGIATLYMHVNESRTVVGFAYGVEYEVAPLEPAVVATVAVEVGQEVVAGQVLAILDGTAIERELAVLEAERSRAEAEVAAARVAAQRDALDRRRELSADAGRIERDLSRARADGRTASAALRAKKTELKRLQALVDDGLSAERGGIAELTAEIATLDARAEGSRAAASILASQLEQARSPLEGLDDAAIGAVIGPIERKLDVIDSRLASRRAERADLVLRAPSDGRVANVRLHAGAVAGPGNPVVSLIGDGGGRVIACVSEDEALAVRVGDAARLVARGGVKQEMRGHVVGLGPLVDRLPSRCRPNIRSRAWGRDVVLLVDDPVELLPGQALDIQLQPAKEPAGAIAASVAPAPGTPQTMRIPGQIASRSRFEPSALVWVPRLVRYVVVSDDTGLKGTNTEHAPWLFTMDAKGRVDRLPLPIIGLDEVSDLEALAVGPSDVLYAMSAQSTSKKGKRPARRERFLRLVPEGTGYRVDGSVLLAPLLESLEPSALAELGISDLDQLEIEGMTAHEGGLLLGLKSPLDADGNAIIWRMERPDRLFAEDSLEHAGLTRWGHVDLEVGPEDDRRDGGISELLALPNGGLLIAATVSDPAADEASGALYWAQAPEGGAVSTVRVRDFDGLKPEGLSLAPTPGRLMVVFDRGADVPMFTELPWPSP